MIALPKLDQGFEMLHEAALDPALWPQALDKISAAADGSGALLLQLPEHERDIRSESLNDMMQFYYRNELNKRDVRVARGLPKSLQNGITVDLDFLTDEETKREPYYEEFLRPHGIRWFAGMTVKGVGTISALSIQRSFAQGPFLKAEQKRLLVLRQAFREAGVIANATAKARAHGYLEGLGLFQQPAALVNASGHVLEINEHLRGILGPGLNIAHNRFRCANRSAENELKAAIALATGYDPRRALNIGRATIPFSENRNLLLLAVPYPAGQFPFLAEARAIVMFKDPAVRRVPSVGGLTAMFGLSLSEARLTAALVRTANLQEAAAECGLTFGSARQYMSRIFEKTATSSQVALVALVAASPLRL